MKRYDEIKQGSLEWFEIKYKKIGGTLAEGLFIDSDTLFIDLLSQNIEEFEPVDGYENDHMERGNDLEPFAREYISTFTGIEFETTGWLECEECSILGISPDGISECEEYATEIKCLSRKEHTRLLVYGELKKDKISQILHYFTVNPKLKKLFFIAFRPESIKPFIKEFDRETLIDMGFKKEIEIEVIGAKGTPIKPKIEKVVDWKTINDWTKVSIEEAKKLELKIKETINQLSF